MLKNQPYRAFNKIILPSLGVPNSTEVKTDGLWSDFLYCIKFTIEFFFGMHPAEYFIQAMNGTIHVLLYYIRKHGRTGALYSCL